MKGIGYIITFIVTTYLAGALMIGSISSAFAIKQLIESKGPDYTISIYRVMFISAYWFIIGGLGWPILILPGLVIELKNSYLKT